MQVGQIYKIKPGREEACSNFACGDGVYIKITRTGTSLAYNILDGNMKKVDSCYNCFKESDSKIRIFSARKT